MPAKADNNNSGKATLYFLGSAAKIAVCLLSYVAGFLWAMSTAFPVALLFIISVVGLPLIVYAILAIRDIPRTSRLMMFLASAMITIFVPVPPYFPVIHSIFFIFPLLVFLFLFIFFAIQQRFGLAISASFLFGSLTTLLGLSGIVIVGHHSYSERWIIGIALLVLTATLTVYALTRIRTRLMPTPLSVK